MNRWRSILRGETEDRELLQSTSRKIILATSVTYLAWHFLATLVWPQAFSPSLWICSGIMILTVFATLKLLEKRYLLSQACWFTGLSATIFIAYLLYHRPEIIFLLALLPMMAQVTLGLQISLMLEGVIVLLAIYWRQLSFLPPPPSGYNLGLILVSLTTTILGWGLSDNLISAIEASSYHYREALKRLEEAREHRAEISVLLKEVSKANYQLDRLNKVLNLARAKADEAREERDRFALSVSHELRSPLNFIIGFSDLMVNSPETYGDPSSWPPGLYEDIQEIYRSSTHLMGLINDILAMGKIDAQQMTLFREKVEFSQIVEEVREMTAHRIEQKGLWLRIELAPDLPALYVDRTRVRQVLLNLVANGLNFTQHGGITLRACMKTPTLLDVEVEDTGAGISPADLPKIFTEFRQVGNQNWRREEGTGLGLAVGRRFIQLHGGEMGVRSELGKGSTFYFTLPVQQPVDEVEFLDLENLRSLSRMPTQNLGEDKRPLLMCLSTETFWARIFAESLPNYKVTLLSDPAALMKAANQVFPQAVIIDQALWDRESVQAFVHNPPYDLPVMSFAIPVNLNKITSLPEGVIRYLLKPVSRQAIVETIQAFGPQAQTLLVVDDDPSMVRFITQTLNAAGSDPSFSNGHVILNALNGTEALNHLKSTKVDGVFLDLDLPDINGLMLIEQIQKDERLSGIPLVIVSANDLPPSLSLSMRGSFELLVNRPLARLELEKLLNSVMETVRLSYTTENGPKALAVPDAPEPPADSSV